MGWWSKVVNRKKTGAAPTIAPERVLVISDIHLGEDVLTSGPESLSGYIKALNRELAGFVKAHAAQDQTAPWHLIINGDMFDFVKVSIQPNEEEAFQHWRRQLSDEERSQLPNTPENVVWKLGRILEIHRPLFKQLGIFILNGHRITIIEGNHDAEFFFPEVQSKLREFLVAEAEKHAREIKTTCDAPVVAARLRFKPWFEASPGRFHIEHGHQYDEFCSFEYNLAPTEHTGDGAEIATPMSHRLLPYFAELLGDFSTHGVDKTTLSQWGKFIFNLGPKMLVVLFYVYFSAMWNLLKGAGSKRRHQLAALEREHETRLQELAESSSYGLETLRRLNHLAADPAEFSVMKMMNVFFLDRLLVGFSMGICWLVALAVGGWFGFWTALTVAVVGGGTILRLAAEGGTPIHETLRKAAADIVTETGARYVVFGHSHHPEVINLSEMFSTPSDGQSSYYLNSGSWVTREILAGEEGRGMTFVEINNEGAFLKQWLGESKGAQILEAAGGSPGPTVEESALKTA